MLRHLLNVVVTAGRAPYTVCAPGIAKPHADPVFSQQSHKIPFGYLTFL